ncbi:hypothetical protein [Pontibacter vulgaris]|uniref:hypothetical protein n=1 Tax=Pontibacter vulgaris TaxID=2905679 RepID=UPI001FA7F419|nr:hypothetical protein [Pontibacter vulgaris]
MKYELEKKIWTDADFEQMGWHDCRIYKIRFSEDLELDIDYILQWNKPDLEGLPFTFWVAPATMVFKRVKKLNFEIDTAFDEAVEIEDIERRVDKEGMVWTILTQQGEIEFLADGYEQFIRQEPSFQFGQTIPYIERYGSSLERTTSQDNPNRLREDLQAQRKKDLEDYENAKKRHLLRQEKEALSESREGRKLSLKDYLVRKKEIAEKLEYYDHWLQNTRFEAW